MYLTLKHWNLATSPQIMLTITLLPIFFILTHGAPTAPVTSPPPDVHHPYPVSTGMHQSLADLHENDCAKALSSKLRHTWLKGENVTIILQREMNASFFFVEDAPSAGIDPIRSFLQRAESNIRELYHHLLYLPYCEKRDEEGLWGTVCASPDSYANSIVVDVGANRGYYTLLSAAYGHEVIAFEPQPHCNMLLNTATIISGYSCKIDNRMAFVTDTAGEMMEVRQRTGCTGTFPNDNHDGWADAFRRPLQAFDGADDVIRVHSQRLDDVVPPGKIVRLLKVDAEGHEERALRSATKLLTDGRVDNILVEFNVPMLKRQPEGWEQARLKTFKLLRWLVVELGYKSKSSHKGHWTHQNEMTMGEWVALFQNPTFTTIDAWFYKPVKY